MHMRKQLLLLSGFVLCSIVALAQRTITGKITDDKGSPVANASVVIKGTNTGTSSKVDGSYSLTVPANAKALVFSSVNMNTVERPLGTSDVVDASLTINAVEIQEVVVTGYGTQRKKEVSGNIATVKGAKLANNPVQSFEQALAGRAT